MFSDIGIYVATYDRKKITKFSLKNLISVKQSAHLFIYDDHSKEYGLDFLLNFTDNIKVSEKNIGIAKIRYKQILHFYNSNLKYCYLIDNDTIHDTEFLDILINLSIQYDKIVSLYNSKSHWSIKEEYEDAYLKYTAGGISIFFNKRIAFDILTMFSNYYNDRLSWDWNLSYKFNEFIYPKQSYVEHIGGIGMNSKNDFYRDIAINPTQYLINERQKFLEVIK